MTNRQLIISQLRRALGLAESPAYECIEFDIMDTTFDVVLEDEAREVHKT